MADWPYGTATWAKLRKAHLSIEPFCRGCMEMGQGARAANTVDHIVAISEGGHPFPEHDGLASYCGPCHSAKTARGTEAGAIHSTRPRKGCSADGTPLDPSHPWRAEKSLRAEATRPTPNPNSQLVPNRTYFGDGNG